LFLQAEEAPSKQGRRPKTIEDFIRPGDTVFVPVQSWNEYTNGQFPYPHDIKVCYFKANAGSYNKSTSGKITSINLAFEPFDLSFSARLKWIKSYGTTLQLPQHGIEITREMYDRFEPGRNSSS
jgi:hypothetical protein